MSACAEHGRGSGGAAAARAAPRAPPRGSRPSGGPAARHRAAAARRSPPPATHVGQRRRRRPGEQQRRPRRPGRRRGRSTSRAPVRRPPRRRRRSPSASAAAGQAEGRRRERRVGPRDDVVPAAPPCTWSPAASAVMRQRQLRRQLAGQPGGRRRSKRALAPGPARRPRVRRRPRYQPSASPHGSAAVHPVEHGRGLVEPAALDQRAGQPEVEPRPPRPAARRARRTTSSGRRGRSSAMTAAAGSSGSTSGAGSVRQSGPSCGPGRRREAVLGAGGRLDRSVRRRSRAARRASWAAISSALWKRSSGSAAVARSSKRYSESKRGVQRDRRAGGSVYRYVLWKPPKSVHSTASVRPTVKRSEAHGRTGPGDLRRLVADRAVDRARLRRPSGTRHRGR